MIQLVTSFRIAVLVAIMGLFMFAAGAGMGIEAATNESVSYQSQHAELHAAQEETWRSVEDNSTAKEMRVFRSLDLDALISNSFKVAKVGFRFGYNHPMQAIVLSRYAVSIALGLMGAFAVHRLMEVTG